MNRCLSIILALVCLSLMSGCASDSAVRVPQPSIAQQPVASAPETVSGQTVEPAEEAIPQVYQSDMVFRVLPKPGEEAEVATLEESVPDMPERNDLTDPRLLAAARAVGAEPVSGSSQMRVSQVKPAAPQVSQVNEPTQINSIESLQAVAENAVTLPAAASQETAVLAARPEPTKRAANTPSPPVVSAIRRSGTEKAAPDAPKKIAAITAASPSPQTTLTESQRQIMPQMIKFYEKQLNRKNIDPVIRDYYERKLEETKAAIAANE